ncbi:MAG: hypothetical protein IKQ32_01630 [Prevotella sp.]|nr:hypothetical protein [Prevotella sp.]
MKKTIIGLTAYVLYGLSVSAQSTLGGLYQVITSTSDFAAGDSIILVSYDAEKNMYAMGTYDSDTGNAFHAINIGTTTADYLPSTISLDAANTSGNAYEYRARIFRDNEDNIESIALQDVNLDYVYGTTDNTNITLSTSCRWTPSKYTSERYGFDGVSLNKGSLRYISYSEDYGFKNYQIGVNYTLAYCYKKIATNQLFRIGSTGYATMYYSSNDVELPDGLTAYTINVTKEGGNYKLHINNIGTSVPHGTAVLISGEANTDYYPTIYSATATIANDWSSVEGNMLHGTDTDALQSNGSGNYFKLADHATKGVGFYWGAADGAAFTNKAHKAYLFLPEELVSASLSDIPFSLIEDGATLVQITKAVNNNKTTLPLYDAAGKRMTDRRIDAVRITGGKKIIGK